MSTPIKPTNAVGICSQDGELAQCAAIDEERVWEIFDEHEATRDTYRKLGFQTVPVTIAPREDWIAVTEDTRLEYQTFVYLHGPLRTTFGAITISGLSAWVVGEKAPMMLDEFTHYRPAHIPAPPAEVRP